jgi:hypothetical protein
MASHQLTLRDWTNLRRDEQIDLMAFEHWRSRERGSLIREVIDKIPGEFGALAQALIMALDI